MGGQYDLYVRIQFNDEIYEAFLPFYMQTHLRLIHKENIGLLVFYQYCQQDGKHLLLTTRQLVGHECLSNLRESYLVLRPNDFLPRLFKQFIHDVLETFLRLRQLLGSIGITLLQFRNDAVADVHLIVQILTLQMVQLEVECRRDALVHQIHGIYIEHR